MIKTIKDGEISVKTGHIERMVRETKNLLKTNVGSGVCLGIGRQQILVELGLWPHEDTEDADTD